MGKTGHQVEQSCCPFPNTHCKTWPQVPSIPAWASLCNVTLSVLPSKGEVYSTFPRLGLALRFALANRMWQQWHVMKFRQTMKLKGTILQKTALSDTSHKFWGPRTMLTSDQLAVNLGVPRTTLRLDNSLRMTQSLRRYYIYYYSVITVNGCKLEPAKGQGEGQVGVQTLSIQSSFLWSPGWCYCLLATIHDNTRVLPTREAHQASVSRVFTGAQSHTATWLPFSFQFL